MDYEIEVQKTQATGTHITNEIADNYLKDEYDVKAANSIIGSMIKTAEDQAEELVNRCINTKTVTAYVTNVETDEPYENIEINLPYRGAYTLTSVSSQDSDGVYTVLDSSLFYIKGLNKLIVKWSVGVSQINSLKLIYDVSPFNLPVGLDIAILKLIADYYTQRSDEGIAQVYRVSENSRQQFVPYQDPNQWI